MADTILSCAGLRRSYGDVVAVRDVGFHIAAGETYGLLGPNGAGKTTSISMICGLLARDAGAVHILGEEVTTTTVDVRRHIGLVPQELAIYPDLTARENLTFFGRLYGLDRAELETRVEEVLATIGLADRADDRAEAYSGGMKRRLNIGLGLLHRPTLLVLDEPTVGVDPQSRNAILEAVELLSRGGMGVLYTTHYMEEAERLCDRVGIIDEGELKAEGTRRELTALVGETDRVSLTASGAVAQAAERLRTMTGVRDAIAHDGGIDVNVSDVRALLPDLLREATTGGATITSVSVHEPDLEAVFLHLTGKALRD